MDNCKKCHKQFITSRPTKCIIRRTNEISRALASQNIAFQSARNTRVPYSTSRSVLARSRIIQVVKALTRAQRHRLFPGSQLVFPISHNAGKIFAPSRLNGPPPPGLDKIFSIAPHGDPRQLSASLSATAKIEETRNYGSTGHCGAETAIRRDCSPNWRAKVSSGSGHRNIRRVPSSRSSKLPRCKMSRKLVLFGISMEWRP